MILALRSDKPEAELYLFDEDGTQIENHTWLAHRQLSNTILLEIESLLKRNNGALKDLTGLIVYQGPGSFTGLRIGISVMNTLAYSLGIPIVGGLNETWLDSFSDVKTTLSGSIVLPEYGSEATITKPKK